MRSLIVVETVEMSYVFVAVLRYFLRTFTLRAIRPFDSSVAFLVLLLRPQLWAWNFVEARGD